MQGLLQDAQQVEPRRVNAPEQAERDLDEVVTPQQQAGMQKLVTESLDEYILGDHLEYAKKVSNKLGEKSKQMLRSNIAQVASSIVRKTADKQKMNDPQVIISAAIVLSIKIVDSLESEGLIDEITSEDEMMGIQGSVYRTVIGDLYDAGYKELKPHIDEADAVIQEGFKEASQAAGQPQQASGQPQKPQGGLLS